MGQALQLITGQVTNPGSTITALTANSGDSYTVRSTEMSQDIELLDCWAFTTTNLLMRIRSPRMHDQAQNIRLQPTASQPYPLLSGYARQKLYSQDPITVELTGGTGEVDAASLLVYYHNLPGVAARLHNWSEVHPLIKNLTTVEVDLTSSSTSGNYSSAVALNANFDTLIRNVDYAILGYQCPTVGLSVGFTGVDTGNLRVGGPLTALAFKTNRWFVDLNMSMGVPTIPVFNSANVAGFNVDMVAQATGTAYKVGVHLAELSKPLAGH